MYLVFDIGSSIEFWRQRYPLDRTPKRSDLFAPDVCASTAHDVKALLPSWVDEGFLEPCNGVLHALDCCGRVSKRGHKVSIHRWNSSIPRGSFYELQPGVLVESPAFMFLQAGSILNLPTLIAFGDELCGLYSFDKREKRGFRKRKKPLASKADLEHFVMQATNCKGRRLCMRALPYIVEGSASPMETLDEMSMCLPYRYGGYGLIQPNMNQRVDLTERAMRIAKRRRCYLDMGYVQFNLDVEHHGKLDHTDEDDRASDRARVNGLKEMGIEVIELTADQVGDLFAFEIIIQRIARITGKRIRKEALGATPERLELREALYRWNETYGRIR